MGSTTVSGATKLRRRTKYIYKFVTNSAGSILFL